MTFPTATASYFALHDLLGGSPHDPRTVRLLVEATSLSGKTYPAGTEVRVIGDGQSFDGFIDGDWLSLSRREFASA